MQKENELLEKIDELEDMLNEIKDDITKDMFYEDLRGYDEIFGTYQDKLIRLISCILEYYVGSPETERLSETILNIIDDVLCVYQSSISSYSLDFSNEEELKVFEQDILIEMGGYLSYKKDWTMVLPFFFPPHIKRQLDEYIKDNQEFIISKLAKEDSKKSRKNIQKKQTNKILRKGLKTEEELLEEVYEFIEEQAQIKFRQIIKNQ